MGNAAEVSINRWGINLFWMQTWFVGKSFQLFFQKSLFMEQFIRTFLLFGMRYTFMYSNRDIWNNRKRDHVSTQTQRGRYFRQIEIRNEETSTSRICTIRNRVLKIYFSKIWFLRYQNWIVLVTHFFQIRPKRIFFGGRHQPNALTITNYELGGGFWKKNALSRRMHLWWQWRRSRDLLSHISEMGYDF